MSLVSKSIFYKRKNSQNLNQQGFWQSTDDNRSLSIDPAEILCTFFLEIYGKFEQKNRNVNEYCMLCISVFCGFWVIF